MLLEVATRRCDLITSSSSSYTLNGASTATTATTSSIECWQLAAARWPGAAHVRNELGNALLRVGRMEDAMNAYEGARSRYVSSLFYNAQWLL
jgi:hypothetical protein